MLAVVSTLLLFLRYSYHFPHNGVNWVEAALTIGKKNPSNVYPMYNKKLDLIT